MAPRPPTRSDSPHTHGPHEHCSHCGATPPIERSYDVNDRFARSLLAALCRAQGLQPYARSKHPNAPIYLGAKDVATLDQISTRFEALVPLLDDELLQTFRAFLKKHCDIDLPDAPR